MSKKKLLSPLFFLVCLVGFGFLINFLLPQAPNSGVSKGVKTTKAKAFSYVAVGDSLTEGIGDSTKQGGFIPILSRQLESQDNYQVTSKNYGVAGETSQQILDRMKSKKELQKSLKKADLMTLTVGGNDVMTALKKNISDLSKESFKKPAKTYKSNLKKIIQLARQDNPNLPIYIVGIYNPFYLNFPDMTQMQEVVDEWNDGTQEVTEDYKNVYFVPVNDLLYKGIDGKQGVSESETSSSSSSDETADSQEIVNNDALFEGDHFHPNNTGYQIMANAILEKINETKDKW